MEFRRRNNTRTIHYTDDVKAREHGVFIVARPGVCQYDAVAYSLFDGLSLREDNLQYVAERMKEINIPIIAEFIKKR